MAVEYTSDSIRVVQNLDHIRSRPKGYIKSRDSEGITFIIWEYIANSIDELTLIEPGTTEPVGGTIHLAIFKDTRRNRFQVLVRDSGRGIPGPTLVNAMTVTGTSGKNPVKGGKRAYFNSGGQFGYGAKTASALSSRYRTITKNYLEHDVYDVCVADGKVLSHSHCKMDYPQGVTALFELDTPNFFNEGDDFTTSGYLQLVNLCKQLNVFNETVIFKFYIYDRPIKDEYFTAPIPEALGIVDDFLTAKEHEVAYDSSTVIDKSSYLFETWRTNSDFIYQDTFKDFVPDDNLNYHIKMFITRKSATGNTQYFVDINNVSLVDKTGNEATTTFMNILREKIAACQESEEFRNFVLNDYHFPTLLLAIHVMRDEAELTGITKTSYKDELFAKDFDKNLRRLFDERGPEFFPTIAKLLSDDILLRYAQFYDTPMKKSEGRKIFADLHFFRNFFECKSPDRQKCELCIVEGTSAGNVVKARNNEFQAVYETKGKPYNPATFLHDITTNRKRLMQDKIYQDISRIINVGLNSTDMSTSNYGKIIIMSDADPDGYHIAALHVNNLYLLNPRLIESGMVWVAKPPLYAMELSKKRYMFLRDKHALYDARIEFIYEPALEISVQTHKGIYPATKDLYREIIYMVKETGEQIEAVAKQLDIPLLIIERLLYGIEFLFPKVRIHDVSSCFKSSDLPGHVRVIERDDDVLIVVIGDRNYVIGLQQIGATLIRYLGPLLKKYRLNEVTYLIRTKGKGSIYESKPQPMTAMMLYSCLQVLDEKLPLKVHRYKGLGQMPTECCFSTLMNPDTRSITQIKSIGDIKENYSLIGTDTTGRKDLLRSSVALSSSFLREQALLF